MTRVCYSEIYILPNFETNKPHGIKLYLVCTQHMRKAVVLYSMYVLCIKYILLTKRCKKLYLECTYGTRNGKIRNCLKHSFGKLFPAITKNVFRLYDL